MSNASGALEKDHTEKFSLEGQSLNPSPDQNQL